MARDEQIIRKYGISPSPAKGVFARFAKQARSAMQQQQSLPTGDIMTADSVDYLSNLTSQKSDLAKIEANIRHQKNQARTDLQRLDKEVSTDTNQMQRNLNQLELDIKNMEMGTWGTVGAIGSVATGINSALRSYTNWRDRKAGAEGEDAKPTGWIYKGADFLAKGTEIIPALKARRNKEVAKMKIEQEVSNSIRTREEADEVYQRTSEQIMRISDAHDEMSVGTMETLENLERILLDFESVLQGLERK